MPGFKRPYEVNYFYISTKPTKRKVFFGSILLIILEIWLGWGTKQDFPKIWLPKPICILSVFCLSSFFLKKGEVIGMPYSRKSKGMMTDDRVSIPALTRAIKSLAFLLYQMPAEFSCCWVTGRSNIIFKICPWLHQMINNYLQFSLLLESWSISVTGVGIHVIDKWQMPRYVCCSPVAEKWIQKSLISPCSWETKMNIILKWWKCDTVYW